MPEINFVLPHWLYWASLLLFPLLAGWLYRRSRLKQSAKPVSTGLAYFFWATGGFLGIHRLYVKSPVAAVFAALLVAVLMINVEARLVRDEVSAGANAVKLAENRISRGERNVEKAQKRLERRDNERNRERLAEAETKLADAKQRLTTAKTENDVAHEHAQYWENIAKGAGLAILLLMLIDAALIPRLVARCNAREHKPTEDGIALPCAETVPDFVLDKSLPWYERYIDWFNAKAGEFVAYWSLIAVFAYYYEVIARYVFNSPTNWAHEAMFLMFGMQYLMAGGFCLRENAHVRVDVLYTHLSERGKALADLITSVFFFIFTVTLLVTGWIFFHDAWSAQEVSFTEWGIQYYPVKFALPLGAALLLLQGIVRLFNDIAAYRGLRHLPPESHCGA